METNKFDVLRDEAKRYVINKGPNLVGAIIILIAGFLLARTVCRLLQKWLERREMEPPVRMLLTRVTWLIIMALFFMVALGTMGIVPSARVVPVPPLGSRRIFEGVPAVMVTLPRVWLVEPLLLPLRAKGPPPSVGVTALLSRSVGVPMLAKSSASVPLLRINAPVKV